MIDDIRLSGKLSIGQVGLYLRVHESDLDACAVAAHRRGGGRLFLAADGRPKSRATAGICSCGKRLDCFEGCYLNRK
jgi:hypothetical protein